jgi:uncharacterized protein (DUF983 family)
VYLYASTGQSAFTRRLYPIEELLMPAIRRRSTDSAMQMPTARRAGMLLLRLLRLRCPNCGNGKVLARGFAVRDRCPACNFRYERSDENYFQGAMFVNFMLGGFSFGVTFLAILLVSWPNVPWNMLTFGVPIVMIIYMIALYPISKCVWLTVDVAVRPVTPDELR